MALAPVEEATEIEARPNELRPSAVDELMPTRLDELRPSGFVETPALDHAASSLETRLSKPHAEMNIPAARHQVAGRDCRGDLVFTANDFHFVCNGDDFTINRAEVEKLDKNGVKLFAAHNGRTRYHFAVDDMSPDDVNNLFNEWMETTSAASGTHPERQATQVRY
jgi:hypothetical protein